LAFVAGFLLALRAADFVLADFAGDLRAVDFFVAMVVSWGS
jgi:hypothetical protein